MLIAMGEPRGIALARGARFELDLADRGHQQHIAQAAAAGAGQMRVAETHEWRVSRIMIAGAAVPALDRRVGAELDHAKRHDRAGIGMPMFGGADHRQRLFDRMLGSPSGGGYQARSRENSDKLMNQHKHSFLTDVITTAPAGLTPSMSALPARRLIMHPQSIKPSGFPQCQTAPNSRAGRNSALPPKSGSVSLRLAKFANPPGWRAGRSVQGGAQQARGSFGPRKPEAYATTMWRQCRIAPSDA